jgi:hypothetical protein
MGIDISAYSNLKRADHDAKDHTEKDYDSGEHHTAFVYSDFPRSFRGLEDVSEKPGWMSKTDKEGKPEFIGGSCYVSTPETEEMKVLRNSYGGFNNWRTLLAASVGVDWSLISELDPETTPFYEILWFADNEGTIGPEACRDLIEDFNDENRAKFVALAGERQTIEWLIEREISDWDSFKKAVELAANNGLIDFH